MITFKPWQTIKTQTPTIQKKNVSMTLNFSHIKPQTTSTVSTEIPQITITVSIELPQNTPIVIMQNIDWYVTADANTCGRSN